ncbi:flagellar protein FliT [Halomonas sp. YLGW01]|uniref:flagellar protein FliT n=1 Tax=Halomonas sp. YLGW01 TaxID=2773308 RepID=UPI001785B5BA|nr:flagellar protein FliT [Halomonas sp. YLGW01]
MADTQVSRQHSPQAIVIAGHEALLRRTSRMLSLANAKEWTALVDEESRYLLDVERLARFEADVALDDEGRARKAQLLEQVLEQSMEVRRRLIERRDELGRLIVSGEKKRQVGRAYRAQEDSRVLERESRFTQGRS